MIVAKTCFAKDFSSSGYVIWAEGRFPAEINIRKPYKKEWVKLKPSDKIVIKLPFYNDYQGRGQPQLGKNLTRKQILVSS